MSAAPADPRPIGTSDAAGYRAAAQPWLKLAALVLVLAALGLRSNDLFRLRGSCHIATVLVVGGQVTARGWPWLGAAAAVGTVCSDRSGLAAPRIEEGHNVSWSSRAAARSRPGCRRRCSAPWRPEFDAKYPPERRCDPATFGCWRGQKFPDRPFAFSADGIYDARLIRRTGDRHRFLRSGLAPPRVHQRVRLQLGDYPRQRRSRIA